MSTTLIFNQPYNVCPRYPNGTKWEVFAKGRYSQACWNMVSFAEALAYLRQQYENARRDTKARRNVGDEYCEQEFRGYIDGPGGRLAWDQLKPLCGQR